MRQLIEVFPLPVYSIISTLLFVGMFVGIVFWTFRIQSRESMEERAKIPFKDSDDLVSKSGVQQ